MVEMDAAAQLREIEAIKQLKARYFRLIDTKQWTDLRRQFCEDCVYEGTSAPFADADDFIAAMRVNHARTSTVHHGHMPEIVLESETSARGIWSMVDYVTWSPGEGPKRSTVSEDMWGWMGFGYYQERYRKEGSLWKIALLRLTRLRLDSLTGPPPQSRDGLLAPALDWLPAR